jgi:DNA-binding FadR family transcriptional regulator
MERRGLVSHVEAELERRLSLGLLPADRGLPSERELARHFGVSRATLREALRRLSARGLVVQRAGRRTRAVEVEEAVTLESVSVVLHGEGRRHPDRWRLLEGYFALKREVTVELLADCCERARKEDLDRLGDACFTLRDLARWTEEGSEWARQEFALLRLAAYAVNRPGHLLLIQSLERAFWAMAGRVLPHLSSEAVRSWALCALHALGERNAQELRRELPPLLQACDERVLRGLAPASQAAVTREAPCGSSASEPTKEGLSGAVFPEWSDCQTTSQNVRPTGGLQSGVASRGSRHESEES